MNTETIRPHTPGANEAPADGPARRVFVSVLLALGIGALSGTSSALFLWSLDAATALRLTHPETVFLLPVAGVLMVRVYERWGSNATKGNRLILDCIRMQSGHVPARMALLIFATSVLSHLVGASTGREGAAVQMGGGLASLLLRLGRLPQSYTRSALVAGVAGGFSSIFGTPLAGAMFSLEAPGKFGPPFTQIPVALIAAFTGNFVCQKWGATHASYLIPALHWTELLSLKTLSAVLFASVLFGWTGRLFILLQNCLKRAYQRLPSPRWVPPVLGGVVLVCASQSPQLVDYLGLSTWSTRPGAVTLASAFVPAGADDFSWFHKLWLTALSLASGFKGGEVTPLFFVGSTLGNALATHLHLSPPLFAALGFVAVFTGAAHTPWTGTLIAMELFGGTFTPLFAPVCWIAHWACGKRRLYRE